MKKKALIRFLQLGVIVTILGGLVAFLVFFSVTIEVAPETRILVLDKDRKPKEGVVLRQFWYQYSFDGVFDEWDGDDWQTTNASGIAVFSAKVLKITPLLWLKSRVVVLSNIMNPHYSFGPDAFVLAINYSARTVSYKEILAADIENRPIVVVLK